jgi:hypothetical protein
MHEDKKMLFWEPKISQGLSGSPESLKPKIRTRIPHFQAIPPWDPVAVA